MSVLAFLLAPLHAIVHGDGRIGLDSDTPHRQPATDKDADRSELLLLPTQRVTIHERGNIRLDRLASEQAQTTTDENVHPFMRKETAPRRMRREAPKVEPVAQERTQQESRGSSRKQGKRRLGRRPSVRLKPGMNVGIASFLNWRERHLGIIDSTTLARAPQSFYSALLLREWRAADRLGNNDGCVSADEHPNMPLFLEFFGGSAGDRVSRICRNHLKAYIGSSAFQHDVASVRAAHRRLQTTQNLRSEMIDVIGKELQKIHNAEPLSVLDNETIRGAEVNFTSLNDIDHQAGIADEGDIDPSDPLFSSQWHDPNASSQNAANQGHVVESEIARSEHQTKQLKAQLEAQMEWLRQLSDDEFRFDEGLEPLRDDNSDQEDDPLKDASNHTENVTWVNVSQDELSTFINDSIKEHELANEGVFLSMPMLRSLYPPPRTRLHASQSKESSSAAAFEIYGPCVLLHGGSCVGSPNYPHSHNSNDWCWIKPTSKMRLRVEAFDINPFWSWMYSHPTYYTGKRGPMGLRVSPDQWIAYYASGRMKRRQSEGHWKVCKQGSFFESGVTPCLGRADLCELKLHQVTVLGAHNAGASRKLYAPCGERQQECVNWKVNYLNQCAKKFKRCKTWGRTTNKYCSQFGIKYTHFASKKACGMFSWLCGYYVDVGEIACEHEVYIDEAVCLEREIRCKAFEQYPRYLGCRDYEWKCKATSAPPAVDCLWQNQRHGFRGQLARGARYFEIETCLVSEHIRFCHGHGGRRAIGTSVVAEFGVLHDWLLKNTHEVAIVNWKSWDHGTSGLDYPSTWDGEKWHNFGREMCVTSFFTKYTGTPCVHNICFTTDNDMPLSRMIEHNVRLVTYGNGIFSSKLLYVDSEINAAVGQHTEDLMNQMEAFCDATPEGGKAGFSSYVDVLGGATCQYVNSGDSKLECPRNCERPASDRPRCQCAAGTGQKETLVCETGTNLSALVQSRDEQEYVEQAATAGSRCAERAAGGTNQLLAERLSGIVERCLARNVSVQVFKVDYVNLYRHKLIEAINVTNDKNLAKWSTTTTTIAMQTLLYEDHKTTSLSNGGEDDGEREDAERTGQNEDRLYEEGAGNDEEKTGIAEEENKEGAGVQAGDEKEGGAAGGEAENKDDSGGDESNEEQDMSLPLLSMLGDVKEVVRDQKQAMPAGERRDDTKETERGSEHKKQAETGENHNEHKGDAWVDDADEHKGKRHK